MCRVVEALQEQDTPEAVLIPQGLLGLLPLHAAWHYANGQRSYALDEITFRYAPNAQVLLAAQQRAELPETGMLSVGSLDPAEYVSPVLCQVAGGYFSASKHTEFVYPAPRKEPVWKMLDRWLVHFACHGEVNFNNPLQSSLSMPLGREPLRLGDILQSRLQRTRMAVLSACETGIPGTKLLDEVVSLPAGLLQAGFGGVAASLWLVDDRAATLLLTEFYRRWLGEAQPPAQALRHAQQWLRDADAPALCAALDELLLKTAHPDIRTNLQELKGRLTGIPGKPYAHPFYWAAFGYTGV